MLSLLPRILCKGTDWGLRDYGTAKWEGGNPECDHLAPPRGGRNPETAMKQLTNTGTLTYQFTEICGKCGAVRIDSQLGLEKTPEEYVQKMVAVFREVRRVLKKEGTLWLNLGDCYCGSGTGQKDTGKAVYEESDYGNKGQRVKIEGLKPKDLVGIPWRVAFALQADGWYLRQDIIWSKPNPMPESVTDRCTKSHEYVFLLTKSPKYYYDAEAIKEPHKFESIRRACRARQSKKLDAKQYAHSRKNEYVGYDDMMGKLERGELSHACSPTGSNKRSVWTITTKLFSEAHFATFPEDLVEPMIKAGTSEKGVCPDCGKPWVRISEIEYKRKNELPMEHPQYRRLSKGKSMYAMNKFDNSVRKDFQEVKHKFSTTIGWKPSCDCGKEPVPAVVLDPFAGSGTALVVAKRLGRSYLGIELNPEYVKMIERSLISMRDSDDMRTLKDIDEGKQMTVLKAISSRRTA